MRKILIISAVFIVSLILIGGVIMFFFLSKMVKEPIIVTMQNPIKFVGLSINTDAKSIYKDAGKLGKEYQQFKEMHKIPNLQEPWAFVAYSKDFNEATKSWEYIMGDVVTNLDSIPEGLNGYEIPAMEYAIFPIKAKFKFLWGLEIGRMKRYIFTNWLPNSIYKSTGCDFEYHDERSIGKNPSIDLYVAIEEKNKI
jgi:predicted transcriptional regulator YdeE